MKNIHFIVFFAIIFFINMFRILGTPFDNLKFLDLLPFLICGCGVAIFLQFEVWDIERERRCKNEV